MPYKGAFQCEKCPRTNDVQAERACPAWWETTFTNEAGEVRSEKSCGWIQLPTYLIQVIKAANRPAGELSKIANNLDGHMKNIRKDFYGNFGLIHTLAAGNGNHRPQLGQSPDSDYPKLQSTDDANSPGDQ